MLGKPLPLGPVMLDVAGTALTAEEREVLRHPAVGGVILFSRNYSDPAQLAALTAEIHAVRSPPLLIAVDHEGGRVQRFRAGFTRLPPMRDLGRLHDADPAAARRAAHAVGEVLALELRAHGIDFSFAPVLDLDHGNSGVIGDRAFHSDPHVVAELALLLVRGLGHGGMGAVAKHFPGHGFASADSHTATAVDERTFDEIAAHDMLPFRHLVSNGLTGVMPAHVIYPKVDPSPAGFSRRWLHDELRVAMGFRGVIFSDDLSMVGAHGAGSIVDRARAALDAGCDMALVCNDPGAARTLIANLGRVCGPVTLSAMARLHGHPRAAGFETLREIPEYVHALNIVARLATPSGDLRLA